LSTHPYLHIITFDYLKAFDIIKHSSLADKLAKLTLPDFIYNWIIQYLQGRSHRTKLQKVVSGDAVINSSVVQGSVLGPIIFNINSADLIPLSPTNSYFKYADDAYLIVPSTNTHTISAELTHHAN